MRQSYLLVLIGLGGLFGFLGYCAAIIDWVQDVRTGVYEAQPLEAGLETGALLIYSYMGLVFLRTRIPRL